MRTARPLTDPRRYDENVALIESYAWLPEDMRGRMRSALMTQTETDCFGTALYVLGVIPQDTYLDSVDGRGDALVQEYLSCLRRCEAPAEGGLVVEIGNHPFEFIKGKLRVAHGVPVHAGIVVKYDSALADPFVIFERPCYNGLVNPKGRTHFSFEQCRDDFAFYVR